MALYHRGVHLREEDRPSEAADRCSTIPECGNWRGRGTRKSMGHGGRKRNETRGTLEPSVP